ncbi:MAG: phosphate ABC transporter substrate-binding protein PstS family protein [Candidatus Thermoplasmatota archaeon]
MQTRHLLTAVAVTALFVLAGCAGTTSGPAPANSSAAPTNAAATSAHSSSSAASFGTSTGGSLKASTLSMAGSSTVFPLAEAWAEEFGDARNVQVTVAGGGSTTGANKFCAKEIDIGDMSRTMRAAEIDACKTKGLDPVAWKIAYDALSVVVSPENTFAKDLTVAQLRKIFQKDNHAQIWNEVDGSFPSQPIRLCIPGAASGTYEYFNEAILGSSTAAPRTGLGVQQSEDDNVLVQCVKDDKYAIGYFGLAYVTENPGKVVAIKVNSVAPGKESVEAGTYTPLSRYIYMVTNGNPKGTLTGDFIRWITHPQGGQALVGEVGYVQLDAKTAADQQALLA